MRGGCPATRFRRLSICATALLGCLLTLDWSAAPTCAGTIRDDVSDAAVQALATSKTEYSTVAALEYDEVYLGNTYTQYGAGVLISSRWVLTGGQTTGSAQSTVDQVRVKFGTTLTASQFFSYPTWDGNAGTMVDLGLVRLPSAVTSVAPAVRYAGSAEIGSTFTSIAYGAIGNGTTGDGNTTDGLRRANTNTFDALGSVNNTTDATASNYLIADFDKPNDATRSSIGTSTPTAYEGGFALYDEGGGAFITLASGALRLAGIGTYADIPETVKISASDGTIDGSYGDLSGFTRVSLFNDWIDDSIAAKWKTAGTSGNLTDGTKWNYGNSTTTAPIDTDLLEFAVTSNSAFTVTFPSANTAKYQKFIVTKQSNVTFALNGTQTANSAMLAGSLIVGRDSGDSASLTLDGGSTTGTLSIVDGFIGRSSGATGTLIVGGATNAASLTASESLYVGGSDTAAGGTGTFTVNTGRTATITKALKIWTAASTVNATGTISAATLDFVNGTIQAAATGGAVNLSGTGSTWSGGSIKTNGNVNLLNGATLSWSAGVLATGGTLSVASGATLTLSGSGVRDMQGGTLTNAGTVVYTGTSDLSDTTTAGVITNQSTGLFNLQNNQTLAYTTNKPTFTNNGILRKTVVTGTSTINWTLNTTSGSQIDVQTGTLVIAGGGTSTSAAFKTSSGATLTFSAPYTFDAASTWTNAGTVNFNGTSATVYALTNDGTMNFNATTATAGTVTGVGTLTVGNAAKVTATSIRQNALSVGSGSVTGGVAKIAASGSNAAGLATSVSQVTTLTIANNGVPLTSTGAPFSASQRTYYGQLDLSNNDLIIKDTTTATFTSVNDMVRSGIGNLSTRPWTGTGLTSSYAQTGNSLAGSTGLGVMRNVLNQQVAYNASTNVGSLSTFDGLTLTGGEILVKFTWNGDLNLDGQFTAMDFALMDAGMAGTKQPDNLPGWAFGDLNYDGVTNATDSGLMSSAYTVFKTNSSLALPEPSTLLLGIFGLIGLLTTGRRRVTR